MPNRDELVSRVAEQHGLELSDCQRMTTAVLERMLHPDPPVDDDGKHTDVLETDSNVYEAPLPPIPSSPQQQQQQQQQSSTRTEILDVEWNVDRLSSMKREVEAVIAILTQFLEADPDLTIESAQRLNEEVQATLRDMRDSKEYLASKLRDVDYFQMQEVRQLHEQLQPLQTFDRVRDLVSFLDKRM